MDEKRLARALGWFSLVLGTAEVLAPRRLCRALGVRNQKRLVQMYGLREIAAGLGVLSQGKLAPWMWARVAGDALDLSTLVVGAHHTRRPKALGAAIASIAAVTALDFVCGKQLTDQNELAAA
jgi:hypothetical protein